MKNINLTILLLILSITNLCAQKQHIDPSVIIVKIHSDQLKSAQSINTTLNGLLRDLNASASPMFNSTNKLKSGQAKHAIHYLYRVQLEDEEQHSSCLTQLNKQEYVAYAEPYYIPHLLDTVNDPLLVNQYHTFLTEIIPAHTIQQGDTNIVIGIVDTGMDMDHEDLVQNIKINYNDPFNGIDDDQDGYIDNYHGWDVANNDPNPECTDSTYHGVLVAGMASATTNNEIGIASPGYHCKILPIKAANNAGYLTAAYEGIIYAADHGCHVINCSWGDTVKNQYMQDIVDYAVNYRGCIIVAAAGNAKNNTPYYPASLDGVISVGATGRGDIKWEGSTFGIELDLVAPGKDIYTTGYNNSYRYAYGGTSYAAPQVAGVAALLLANEPNLNARQIAEKIRVNTDVIDTIYENQYYLRLLGHGRLNAYKALSDDSLPGLRVTKQNIHSSNSSLIAGGDTAFFEINVMNYLKKAGSTSVLFSDNSDYTTVVNDLHRLGDINTLDSANNYGSPFSLLINKDMPYDHEFIVSYDMVGNGFKDYQQFKVIANRSYYNVQPNSIATSFTSNGNIGYSDRDQRIGDGFIYNNLQMLNTGGIIFGNSTTEMVSSMDKGLGFDIDHVIDTTEYSDSTIGVSSYSPSPLKWDIDIEVKQTNRAYTEDGHEATIYFSYELINQSENPLNDYRFSQFIDWNIYNANANRASYDEALNMVYTHSYGSGIAYAGICLLNDLPTIPYCFDLVEGGNGGIDITTAFSDQKKWFAMNNARPSGGDNSYRIDVATMLTCGPFDFISKDTINLTFALIAASNLEDLKQKARAAKQKFSPPSTSIVSKIIGLDIYPNPANDKLYIDLKDGILNACILYNNKGEVVIQTHNKTTLNTSKLPDGLYFIAITANGTKEVRKIVISH